MNGQPIDKPVPAKHDKTIPPTMAQTEMNRRIALRLRAASSGWGLLSIVNVFASSLFVGFVEVEPGLDIIALGIAALSFDFCKFLTAAISAAVRAHESIPNLDLLLARLAAIYKAPLENLFVAATAKNLVNQRGVGYAQKSCAARVEPGPIRSAKIVSRRKTVRSIQPDLIEHAAKEDDAIDLFIVASQAGNFHNCRARLAAISKKFKR